MLRIKLKSLLYCLFWASILSAIATVLIKHPAVTQELDGTTSPIKLTEKTKSDSLVEQLIGRWKIELPNGKSSVFIFAPDGDFFDLSIPKTAIRFNWVIDRNQPQPQVFVNFGIGILKANLSDSEMQMRFLPLAPMPNTSSEAIEKFVLPTRKLSSDYSLPVGTSVIEAEEHYRQQANSAKQSEAKQYISSINKYQETNFWEYQKFIPNIEKIAEKIGIKSQTSNYNYQVFLSEDGSVANVLAIPRDDNLKAYFGRVTTESNTTGLTFIAIRCESIKPTNNIPSLPLPTLVEGNLECPTDYEALKLSQRQKQSEAKIYISSINKVQEAHFQRNQKFIGDIQEVIKESGIKSQTSNYNYQVFLSEDGRVANVVAIPRGENLKAYVGRITTESNTAGVIFVAIRCESINPTNNIPSLSNVVGGNLQCPTDYEVLNLKRSSPLPLPVKPLVPHPSFSPVPLPPFTPKPSTPRLPSLPLPIPKPSTPRVPSIHRIPEVDRLPRSPDRTSPSPLPNVNN